MNISELFYSIQGEGKRTGYPSFFIRTNLCNLRCQFSSGNLCDTPYTSWEFNNKDNLGEIKIHDMLFVYKNYFPCDIVVTGGEPTIQQKELNLLCSEIKKLNQNIFITIETNGTFIDDYVNNIDLVSVSPKLITSIPIGTEFAQSHDKHRLNYKVLKSYHKLHREEKIDIQWKFVITGIDDIQEILDLQKEIGFENKDIFLMPEGITEKDLSEKRLKVVELCKQYHFNYTDRLHVIIWGIKRGV